MAKRYNSRAIKKHHSYTIEEAAMALNLHPQTIRSWCKNGLPCLTGKTPHLILGTDLQDYIRLREKARKQRLGLDQLFCLSCRSPKYPAGMMVDFIPGNSLLGRLTGICPTCDSLCHRFVREDKISSVGPNLEVSHQAPWESLEEQTEAPSKTQLSHEE